MNSDYLSLEGGESSSLNFTANNINFSDND